MRKTHLIILFALLFSSLAIAGPNISKQGGGGGTSFSVTDITGQTDDTTPATTATAVLAQGGSLIESTLAEIATAIGVSANPLATDSLWDAAGDLVQGTGANTSAKLTKGAEGTILRAGAASNAYSTSTFADTYAKGTILYNASANTVAGLAHPGAANYFLATNATDTAAWLLGTNLASLNGLTFADASIIQLTGAGASAVLTSGGSNYILGSSSDNSSLEFKTPANVLSQIGAQATDSDLTTIAGLSPVENKIMIGSSAPAWSVSAYTLAAPGLSGGILQSDGTNWARVTSLTGLSYDIGDSVASGHAVTMDANGVLQTAFTALLPDAASGADIGAADREWGDVYLKDGAVIKGQNDQSATLTSSASLWTANNFAVTTQFKLPSSDADPTATAGYIRHDSSDTDASAGGILEWHDGTNTRRVVDGAASAAANYTVIVKTEYLPIRYAEDGTTGPAAAAEISTTTAIGRGFDKDADEDVVFWWVAPLDYVGGIKYRVIYALAADATADDTAVFSLAGCAAANSAALGCTPGTAVTLADELGTDDDQFQVMISDYSSEVTITNIAAGSLNRLVFLRDVSEDDYTEGDLLVIGIEIKYKARINLVDTY